ncbi:MAG: NUDIX hydrolase [Methylococcaceae bacterium]|nr:NUDIX hydrolase [Methylococcaceae bacterium]
MTADLIKTLLDYIPRYAEEEGDFYSVAREELINALCSEKVNYDVAENTVNLIENLLDTLAVLNSDYLQKGEWCFISFPAQLLALSVLTAMNDKDSRFFADNFWNTQGISDDKKNKQRDLLSYIETNRVECHATHNAPPIRYIYVAWSIIKLDDKILFHQREDTKKRHDDKSGDYVLVGGRLNQRDNPAFSSDKKRYLQQLQSNDALLIEETLPETLKRELYEEAGLIFDSHYRFKPWRNLKPYRQVQGSAPNHAYTEYYFSIFYIELTLAGYLFLNETIKSDEHLVWFSMTDIENGKTAEDKIAYINALFNDFDNDRTALKMELMALPNSFDSSYSFKPKKYGLSLLQNTNKPLYAGVLGKEKILDLNLTKRQQAILLGLAAHTRGFEFVTLAENVILHPHGWFEIQNNATLQNELIALADLFKKTDFKIENQQDKFFRLSVEPSILYFDGQLFTYRADLNDSTKSKISVTITRAAMTTAFGLTVSKTETFIITRTLARNLQKLAQQQKLAEGEAERIEDHYKKTLHQDARFLDLGLKGLLRREVGEIKFVLFKAC